MNLDELEALAKNCDELWPMAIDPADGDDTAFRHAGTDVSSATILALILSLKDAMAALEDAAEVIHSEFCGTHDHHEVCRAPREALAKIKSLESAMNKGNATSSREG